MNSIGDRHLYRQLAQARRAQATARAELQTLREQIARQAATTAAQTALLLQTMPTALLAENQQHEVVIINQRLCEQWGLPEPPTAYVGRSTAWVLAQATIRFRDEAAVLARLNGIARDQQRVKGELLELTNGLILRLEYLPVVSQGTTLLHLWSYEDVTRQQRQQVHIEELSRLPEQNPHPILRYGADGALHYANPAAVAMLAALSQADAQDCQEFLRHETQRALAQQQTRTTERALADRFYLWTVVPFVPENQSNVYLTDISARRQTEVDLQRSQLFIKRINDTVPNLIYLYDVQNFVTLYCNDQVQEVLGYTQEQLLAMGSRMTMQLLDADQQIRMRAFSERAAALQDGETATIENYVRHRDGSERWLRVRHTPFERDAHGMVRLVVGVIEDITDLKQADEQRQAASLGLAEQNRLFRQVIDSTPHLIYLKDGQGHYLLANQATAELYGMRVEELLATAPDKLPALATEMAGYIQIDQQVISTRQDAAAEKSHTRPNGDLEWFYSIKRPFVMADGTVRVLGIDSNITELKRIQQALRAAKETAEENLRVKQDFLAKMSHEIRTPMNGILGLAGLLAKTSLNEAQHEYLTHIRHSAEQLLVVINDILAMTQISAGKLRVENTPFDLSGVLRACHQLLRPRAAEKGLALELEMPPAPLPVLGDPYRLRQILLNLLSNALKFTARGTVRLSCQPQPGPPPAQYFRFTVTDTGIGIAPHQLEQIFEAFTQAEASTAREYGGSGLGLSISHGLVQLLGGEITVQSRPGAGSTFAFTLPFGPAEASQLPAPVPVAVPDYRSLGNRRALVAEDNPINQFLVKSLLTSWGCHVDTAATGPEALHCFRQHSYDIVLMDIQMPGLDGIATTRLLRQHPDPQRATTPVLALTAHAMREEAQRCLDAGFNAYLSKPYQEEDLFQMIASLVAPRPPVVAPPPAAALYDLGGLRRIAHDNETFVARLAQLFTQTTPPIVRELEQHLAAGQWAQLAATAHHLKSSIDGLRISSLHGPVRELETLATTSPDPARLAELTALVRQVTEQVIECLLAEYPG